MGERNPSSFRPSFLLPAISQHPCLHERQEVPSAAEFLGDHSHEHGPGLTRGLPPRAAMTLEIAAVARFYSVVETATSSQRQVPARAKCAQI